MSGIGVHASGSARGRHPIFYGPWINEVGLVNITSDRMFDDVLIKMFFPEQDAVPNLTNPKLLGLQRAIFRGLGEAHSAVKKAGIKRAHLKSAIARVRQRTK